MTTRRLISSVCCAVLLAGSAAGQDLEPAGGLGLVQHLPREPLVAWTADIGSGAEVFDGILALARKVVPESERGELEEALRSLDASLGIALRDDLLVHLGPEMALSLDLPPIDTAAMGVMAGTSGSVGTALGHVGLWVQVRDRTGVDRALRVMADHAGLEVREGPDGIVRLGLPREKSVDGTSRGPDLELLYALDGGLLRVGFTTEQVQAMGRPAPEGGGLRDGADFQEVVSHLDRGASSLLYVNLPRLQEMLRTSQLVQGALASDEDTRGLTTLLLDPALAPTGFGVSAVEVEGGVRQVSFGPSWMSSGFATAAVVAAIAVPNLLEATDRGRQQRTLAGMRTLGTAAEAYAVDHDAYPSTGGSWADVATLGETLSPTYVRDLPATDGWDHPLRYWSDGRRCRLVSPGRDGEVSGDWAGEVEPRATTGFDDDLVWGDGQFLRYPEGIGGS